jgi:ABC-2 type transport system permease protein
MTTVAHSWYLTLRLLRVRMRQPWYIAVTLVQPIIWLLLFGALFRRVVELPGFGAASYLDFLTPGIVVMTALFAAGWSGMGIIEDLNAGVMDRFLVAPARRAGLIIGRIADMSVVLLVQSLIIVAIGLALGASYDGGVVGIAVLVGASVLLGAAFSSLSNALALLARREETLIAMVQFIVLPATFLSAGLMSSAMMPSWMADAARFNPVNWAVEAGRSALAATPDWGVVLSRCGLLLALALACAWLSTLAFRSYQRSA